MEAQERADGTDARLIAAALELVAERGFKGATTRAIAERAAVAEVTLFRLFGSKAELVLTAFSALVDEFENTVRDPTGDLEADLRQVARDLDRLIRARRGLLISLLPELSRLPAVRSARQDLKRRVIERFTALFEHYRAEGRFAAETADGLVIAFLAPILAAARAEGLLGRDVELEVDVHVDRFLYGWAGGRSP